MTHSIIIRPANIDDSPGLGRAQLDSWQTTPGAEFKPESWWTQFSYEQREQAWRDLLASDRPVTVFAATTANSEIVGFAWTERNSKAFPGFSIELSAIHIVPSRRRQGIGRRLIRATVQRLLEKGFTSLMLWTHKRNEPAGAFYLKLGGVILGQEPVDIDGVPFTNVAIGWPDITKLLAVSKTDNRRVK